MRKNHPKFALSALAAALSTVYGTTAVADSDPAVDDLIKPSSSVSVGVGSWNKDRPQMGMHDGMRKNDAQLLFDADIRKRDDETGTWLTLSVKNLGLDTREIRGEYLQQGKFGAALEYSEFQTKAPYTVNTNQTGVGTNTQTTGTNIPNTAIGSGPNYQFGLDRNRLGISFYRNIGVGLDFRAKLFNEDKKGLRINSDGSGNSLFFADLIDWTTHKAEATLDYSKDKLHLSGGYLGSWFRNNNPNGIVSTGGGTLVTQPLDNQAHQLFASGHYGFSPTTKGTFKLAYTRGTQNENLWTSSNPPSNSYGYIPSLKGRVDTTLVQFGLSAKPLPKLGLTANFRHNEVKDKTPQYGTVARANNLATVDVTVRSTPYSYRTTSAKLEGTYNLGDGYAASAGVDYIKQNRTVFTSIGGVAYNPYVPMRAETDELTYTLQLRKSLSETLNGSLSYAYGDRSGSDYQSITGNAGVAFVSPVNTADRERDKLRLALDWAPTEVLDVQMNLEKAVDKYGNSTRSQGLHKGEADLLSLDANYRINDDWKLGGWYSLNTNDVHLIAYGATGTPTVSRIRKQNDTGHALGFSLTGQVNAKTGVGAELTWANDKTRFDQSNSDGSATGVVAPDIASRITRLKLFADYALDKSSNVRVDLIHEKWNTNDWLWTFQDGKPWQFGQTGTDGTAIITTPKQNATFIGARYVFKFR